MLRTGANLRTEIDRDQLDRKDLAVGSWASGQTDNALLLMETVLAERMSPLVAAECWVAYAGLLGAAGRLHDDLRALDSAAEFIDCADDRVKASYYYERARCHKALGNYDAARLDYSGAAIHLELAGLLEKLAFVENSVADLCLRMGLIDEAHEHAERAIKIGTAHGIVNLAESYDTQAKIFLVEGKLEPALIAIDKAIARVGENKEWLQRFVAVRDRIEKKLLDLLNVEQFRDLDQVKAGMVRRALTICDGSVVRAGKMLGVDHSMINIMVRRHEELAAYRKEVRRKSIIKK